jgi:tripartite-type tricarboxylate transporter receptor subunit TctC
VASTPDQFADWIKDEIAKWGKVIREANITVQ